MLTAQDVPCGLPGPRNGVGLSGVFGPVRPHYAGPVVAPILPVGREHFLHSVREAVILHPVQDDVAHTMAAQVAAGVPARLLVDRAGQHLNLFLGPTGIGRDGGDRRCGEGRRRVHHQDRKLRRVRRLSKGRASGLPRRKQGAHKHQGAQGAASKGHRPFFHLFHPLRS